MALGNKVAAEFVGTFWLVFGDWGARSWRRPSPTRASASWGFRWRLASDGFGEHSHGGYSMAAALTAEIVLTFAFLFVIGGAIGGIVYPLVAGQAD